MAEQPVITCPECKKKFKGKGDLSGKRIKCPFCSQPFVVPAAKAEAVPAAAPPPLPAPPPGKPTWDEEEGPAQYDVKAQDLTPRCPHCAKELLNEKAVVCVYCGYNTLTRTMGQTTKVIEHTFGDYVWHLLPGILAVVLMMLMLATHIYYCVIWPDLSFVRGRWLEFTTHESMRFWPAVFLLSFMWPFGIYAYKRLVLNPQPPEKVKE